jgi:hypothetical protein
MNEDGLMGCASPRPEARNASHFSVDLARNGGERRRECVRENAETFHYIPGGYHSVEGLSKISQNLVPAAVAPISARSPQ